MNPLFTIGYSSYDVDSFIKVLKENKINAIADVRSSPHSKYKPEFDKDLIKSTLKRNGIFYVFLGEELGARTKDNSCYIDGRADHALISKTILFKNGLNRILKGLKQYTIALMCSEVDPIKCHRNILICRHLKKLNISIFHLMNNGEKEENCKTEMRLLKEYALDGNDMFINNEDAINIAYDKRSLEIAYRLEKEKMNIRVKLFTIGFTQKNAKTFFNILKKNEIRTLIDVRLNNVSQLAGFTKKDDLQYFLKEILKIEYVHRTDLSPNEEILQGYKKGSISWVEYEKAFIGLLQKRKPEIELSVLDHACLLCSEPTADKCHRRIVAEYLKVQYPEIEIIHI